MRAPGVPGPVVGRLTASATMIAAAATSATPAPSQRRDADRRGSRAVRRRSMAPAAPGRRGILDVTRLCQSRRIVDDLDRLTLGGRVPAPQRVLRSHALDRAAVRHRKEERPQRTTAGIEAIRLLPETYEHVLYDLLGQRL